ncbi:Mitochondrial fission protein [Tulasnella sp. JGI-2019a]|nr:Mitochondrial fission protein [Tulasnella sp. JGI-2019a]KAG9011500.1 Mitochondrial fission protein [Tulasnella sp. JGI-2019a]KAG9033710.1 Mitochondrial fission protein [Tulasnella sp. JGI-2019a]
MSRPRRDKEAASAARPPSRERDLRDSLAPIASGSSSASSSTIVAVGNALMAPFGHVQRKADTTKILSDLAPVLMTPRMVDATATAASSRSHPSNSILTPTNLRRLDFASLGRAPMRLSLGSRRITSRDLQVVEATDELLHAEIPEPDPDAVASNVSLLRGFNATIPTAERGKTRRRKTRNVDAPHMGLKRLGMNARGMLGGDDERSETGEDVRPGDRRDKKGRRKSRPSLAADVKLGKEELARQKDEILLDKENIHVRRSLINFEIDEIAQKIAALDGVRNQLQQNLLRLHEEELELDDELEGVQERLVLEDRTLSVTNGNASRTTGRRRKGPAFLPSEHDELPPGVAFMTLAGHTAPITALDFSEPYGVLVSASQDDSTRLWDLCTGDEIGRLRGHKGTVKCMQVDDSTCLTGGADSTIRMWDLRRVGEEDTQSSLGDIPEMVEYSDVVSEGGSSKIRDGIVGATLDDARAEDGACVRVLEGHSKAVSALYFEDTCLVSGASDKTLRQWDLSTGQCVLTMDILWAISHPVQPLHSSYSDLSSSVNITSGAFAVPTPPFSDGSWEMYQDFVGAVQFWGYALVSGSGDGCVRMWDMRTGQAHRTLVGHTAPVTCLQFDEMQVVSGSLDKSLRIWDLRTGNTSETIKYDYPVTDLQFDTRKIVACCGENGVKIYNRTTMQQSTLSINGHTRPAEKLRYIDRYLTSGSKDHTVKIWSL